jgi:rRNA processing protein Gar1
MHSCQGDLVLKVDAEDVVPYFNAPIYTEDKNQIGKIDEIFGPIKDYYVSVKLGENIKAKSFKPKDEVSLWIIYKSCIMLCQAMFCFYIYAFMGTHIWFSKHNKYL